MQGALGEQSFRWFWCIFLIYGCSDLDSTSWSVAVVRYCMLGCVHPHWDPYTPLCRLIVVCAMLMCSILSL